MEPLSFFFALNKKFINFLFPYLPLDSQDH
jgi:hypothetical protein